VGFGEAAVLIRQQENDYLSKLQMVTSLCSNIIQSSYPKARIIGENERKLFGILCFLIPYIQADALSTSSSSICVSHGSACNSGTLGISHVIQNLGLTEQEAVSTFRVSLSADTTEDDLIMLQKELSRYVDEGMGTI
jgi:cysteine desulfurase